jgi:uncharacterized protein YprB with RNaseH-like and TPR domain
VLLLDIETSGLNADVNHLIAVGLKLGEEEKIFFANTPKEEITIIKHTMDFLRKTQQPLMIWHSGFDIPFFVARAAYYGVDVSDIYDFHIIDLWKLISNNLKLSKYKLDDVARFFGIEKDLSVTGKDVPMLYYEAIQGNTEAKQKIIAHCIDDLKAMDKLRKILEPYIEKWKNKFFRSEQHRVR